MDRKGNRHSFTWAGTSGSPVEPYNKDSLISATVKGGSGWLLSRQDESRLYQFDSTGRLVAITNIDGKSAMLSYSDGLVAANVAPGSGYLIGVADSFGRSISLTYKSDSSLQSLTDPVGGSVIYTHEMPDGGAIIGYGSGATVNSFATSLKPTQVTYQDATSKTYLWDESAKVSGPASPNRLTGVMDENNKRYSSTSYIGNAASSTQLALGVGSAAFSDARSDGAGTVAITDQFGSIHNWQYTVQSGLSMVSNISQPGGSGCLAATSKLGYDTNGNIQQRDDFNGHRVCYANELSRNLETVRVEGLVGGTDCSGPLTTGATLGVNVDGTQQRKTSTQWHPNWAVKVKEASPNKLTTWVYNGQPDPFNGNQVASCVTATYGTSVPTLPDGNPIVVLCKKVEQSTTDANGSQGFSATVGNGVTGNSTPATRIWTYTYTEYGQILTEDGPRTDVTDQTSYAYYSDTSFSGTAPNEVGHTKGDLQSITDAAGNVLTYTQYDRAGRVLSQTDANGLTTTLTYSPRGFLTSRSLSAPGAATRTTTYHYDPRGLLDSVDLPPGLVSTAAGAGGAASGRHYTYQYDDAHRLTGMTSASGESVVYTLDNSGNITQQEWRNASGATSKVVRSQFDSLNRLYKSLRTINGAEVATEYGYDAQGNLTSVQRPQVAAYGESSAPKEVRRYNALDQLTTIEDALNGAAKPTTLTPKANDDLQALSAPNHAGWSYTLDGFGQTLQEGSTEGVLYTQTFDAAGNLKTRVDALGVTSSFTYDALSRPLTVSYTKSGSSDTSHNLSYRWDNSGRGAPLCTNGIGRLCTMLDAGGTSYFAYDAFGNPVSERRSQSGLSTSVNTSDQWGYDGEDRLSASVSNAAKALAVTRDQEGRVDQVLGVVNGQAASVVNTTSYQAGTGLADRMVLGNGKVFDRDFDAAGAGLITSSQDSQSAGGSTNGGDADTPIPLWALLGLGSGLMGLMSRKSKRAGASATLPLMVLMLVGWVALSTQPALADEAYGYDARGNIQSHTVDGQARTYQYDPLDRIKSETGPTTQTLTYDANGNRTSDVSSTYTLVANSNKLATRNGQAVSYDAAGNILSETVKLNGQLVTRSYTYDLPGRTRTISINGQLKATYLYDYRGLRIRKTLTSPPANTPTVTLYTYNPNGQLFEEISGSGANIGQTLATYVWKDEVPAAVIFAPNTPSNLSTTQEKVVYLEADQLNTPRKGSDQNGKVIWTWDSDAFGSTAPNEDPDGDGLKTTINLRFPGQYYDQESGLFYNANRYYDPSIGRYTQPDQIGLAGGLNPYTYTGSNPLSYVDPEGLQAVPFPIIPPGGGGGSSPRAPRPQPIDPTDPHGPSFTPAPWTLPEWITRPFRKDTLEECEANCEAEKKERDALCFIAQAMGGKSAQRECLSRSDAIAYECRKKCKVNNCNP